MNEHIDGVYTDEDAYWEGYHRGLKESSELWVAIISEELGKYTNNPAIGGYAERIVELAQRELGFRGKPGTTKL